MIRLIFLAVSNGVWIVYVFTQKNRFIICHGKAKITPPETHTNCGNTQFFIFYIYLK
jgi:hypothetical protein